MKKRFLSVLFVTALLLSSCNTGGAGRQESSGTQAVGSGERADAQLEGGIKAEALGYELPKPAPFYTGESEYVPLDIKANVEDIELKSGLANVENLSQFGNLSDAQKEMIERNGFVVNPTGAEQMFYLYEDNAYNKIPNFITADSVLQLYHIFYDYTLRQTEANKLYVDLQQMNRNMVNILTKKYAEAGDKQSRDAAGRTLAYFAVCEKLLGQDIGSDFPEELTSLVESEYANIVSEAQAVSPITGAEIDYSLFKVRGHYTRSEELKKYFGAMSMYGVMPFNFYNGDNSRNEDGARMAIITACALKELEGESGMKLWEEIYVTTEFFVGSSDDVNPLELGKIIEETYKKLPAADEIDTGLDGFYAEIEKLEGAKISNRASGETGLCFRFMGQRYIPDSEILDRLSNEDRPFPSGVDVMAVLGSERAEELLDTVYMPSKSWQGYTDEYKKIKNEFSSKTIYEKTNNIYSTWLFTLEGLNVRFGAGYPRFMQNTAWEDKSLTTSLGSWSQLRHDTILYGKQSGVECGGDEPPEVLGYVEPNPEFYNRLLWLTNSTKEGLSQRGAISDEMSYKCENMIELLEFLKNCSIKELSGERLTDEDYRTLLTYGGTLEYISSSIAGADGWYNIESETDKRMAQIADVHSASLGDGYSYLEVGVGNAAEIYVAVPISGKLYLTRGAVFDYFEFTSSERLTDEGWQKNVSEGVLPDRPPFAGNYMQQEQGEGLIAPSVPYSSGC